MLHMLLRRAAAGCLGLGLAVSPTISALADVLPNAKPDADGIVLANVSISVADLERATKFYQSLGFEVGEKRDIPGAIAKALGSAAADGKLDIRFLRRDGVTLELVHLTPSPTMPASKGSAAQLGLAHIAFRVDDVDRVAEIIKRNGGAAIESSRTKLGPPGQGVDILFCTDPDGTMLEIAGPVKG